MKEVTAAVIIQAGQVLLARRGPTSKLAGSWEFPGGKVEDGETRQECLARELREELGVVADVGEEIAESVYHYSHGSFKIVALLAGLDSNDFTLQDHDMVEWVSISDLLTYTLAPADVPLAREVQKIYG